MKYLGLIPVLLLIAIIPAFAEPEPTPEPEQAKEKKTIPEWFENNETWLSNGQIEEDTFSESLKYLSDNNLRVNTSTIQSFASERANTNQIIPNNQIESNNLESIEYFVNFSSDSNIPGCHEENSCLTPFEITINVGDRITWINDYGVNTISSGVISDNIVGLEFDSGFMSIGETFTHQFDNEGTYPYFSMIHPWASGIVTVEPIPEFPPLPAAPEYYVLWENMRDVMILEKGGLMAIPADGVLPATATSKQLLSGDGYFTITKETKNNKPASIVTSQNRAYIGLTNTASSSYYNYADYMISGIGGKIKITEGDTFGENIGNFGKASVGDELKIAVESGVVNYYKNDELLYTSTQVPVFPLMIETVLTDSFVTINNVKIHGDNWTQADNYVEPVILLNGDNPLIIKNGAAYVDAGATATDRLGNDIADIVIDSSAINENSLSTVDGSVLKQYDVTFSVTDSEGVSNQVIRYVYVTPHYSSLELYCGQPESYYDKVIRGDPLERNTIKGSWGNDLIIGGDGNDLLNGVRGDDCIYGGAGDDYIIGRQGNDIIYGGLGNDEIYGGTGDDIIVALEGTDIIADGGNGYDECQVKASNTDIVVGCELVSSP